MPLVLLYLVIRSQQVFPLLNTEKQRLFRSSDRNKISSRLRRERNTWIINFSCSRRRREDSGRKTAVFRLLYVFFYFYYVARKMNELLKLWRTRSLIGYNLSVERIRPTRIAGTPVRGKLGIESVGAAPTLRTIQRDPAHEPGLFLTCL